jgi:hypothetical protein
LSIQQAKICQFPSLAAVSTDNPSIVSLIQSTALEGQFKSQIHECILSKQKVLGREHKNNNNNNPEVISFGKDRYCHVSDYRRGLDW